MLGSQKSEASISTPTLEQIEALYRQDLPKDPLPPTRPQFYKGVRVRMPEDYDFTHKSVDWSSYKKDYRMRTDAVWEKQQLKDWYRLFNKCFYFNTINLKYEFIEPEDIYTMYLEPWQFENDDVMEWRGFTPTGRTSSFQNGMGPKQRIEGTINTNYTMVDYKYICGIRFERWLRCDMIYYDQREKYDRNPIAANYKTYPCFREYHEASYACQDDYMRRGLELAYIRRAKDWHHGDYSNIKLKMEPTIWDTPKQPERVTYTY